MTRKQQKLIDFAEYVLRSMEYTKEWDADMTDDFADIARHLGLSDTDEQGYFRIKVKL